jgi:hypothetical protein
MQIRKKQKLEFDRRNIEMIIVLAVIIFLESFISPEQRSLDYIMRWIFGYIGFDNRHLFFSSLSRFLLPQIALLLLWGNYIHENVVTNYELIFTRTRKSYKVLWKYIVQLMIKVTMTVLFLEIVLCFVYMIKGCRIDSLADICLDLGLYCVYMDCLIMTVNVISLAVRNIFSVIITLVIQLLLVEGTYHLLQGGAIPLMYYILPTSPIMLMNNMGLGHGIKLAWGIYLVGITVFWFIMGCQYTSQKEYY